MLVLERASDGSCAKSFGCSQRCCADFGGTALEKCGPDLLFHFFNGHRQGGLADKIFDIERYKIIFGDAIPMLWNLGNTPISMIGLIILTMPIVGKSKNRITGLWALAVIVLLQLIPAAILFFSFVGTSSNMVFIRKREGEKAAAEEKVILTGIESAPVKK